MVGQGLHFNSRTFEFRNEPLKVKMLFQGQNGFIWLGTAQGLFQYDGFQTRPVLPVNSQKSIPPVSAIFQDRQQRLWIGCETGQVFFLESGRLQAFKPEEGPPKESILAIQEDAKGYLWFATYGEGLYCWKNQRFYNFNTDDGLPDDYVYALTPDNAGNIWAGTDRGIAVCNFSTARKQVRKIGTEQGLPDNIVTALTICPKKKTIWAGTYSGGFCTIELATQKITVPEISRTWPNGAIAQILPTSATASLITTSGKGIWEFDMAEPTRLIPVHQTPNIAGLNVTDGVRDAEGLVWLAANGPEVYLSNPDLRFVPVAAPDRATSLQAVLADSRGNIWFGTDEGLFCARKQPNGYLIKPAFPDQNFRQFKVISLLEDPQGFLWVGTFGGGVSRIDPATGMATRYTEKNGLVNDNVLSMAGSGNEIWLATLGGASRCKLPATPGAGPLAFENFNQQDGIGFNYIYQVLVDSKKRVWFATDGKGLTKLENSRFTNYSEKDGLASKTVYSVTETRSGDLWISTPKNGLFKFDGKRFTNFSSARGLRDLNISSLQTDKFGNLLILHKKGLDILDPVTGRLLYLGTESGLYTTDQNLNAISKDAAGTVWFSTQIGLAAYQPIAENFRSRPRTRLTGVQLFLKPVPFARRQFDHDENHISFDYAGLWFQQPEEVSYRLKLEGYDREWMVSNNRSITYPKLPPGKYTFKVSSSVTGNFDEALPETFSFRIEKPFWNTYWFYALALLGSGGLLFGLIKSREKRLKKTERLEKDKVMFQFETLKNQVNPHFLFNSFNTLINIIEDDQAAAVEYVEKLSDFFRDILVYREKDTITLREELVLIQNYYFLQQKRYGANLKMQIKVPETDQELLIPPLTLQLLVENAIKHNVVSRDKPLTIEIFTEPNQCLVVRNNLQKKKLPETSTGIGLTNIRNRYAILSKRPVEITENETSFEVKIPLFFPPTP